MKTVHIIVEGRVQGVFFRDYTQREAERLNLKGWVRNRPEGTVELVASGTSHQLDSLVEWLQTGSPRSVVTALRVEEILPTEKLSRFEIRYQT